MITTQAKGGMGCATAHKAKFDSNRIVIKGDNCTFAGGDDIYITYTTVNSLEGIRAAKEVAPVMADACIANGNAYRTVVDVTSCSYPSYPSEGSCTKTTCNDIELSTSDVEGSSFNREETHGATNGHRGGNYLDITLVAESTTGLKNYKPVVVPFAFYANNDLGGATPAAPMNNLTRTQALNIFSGSLYDWGQLKGFSAYAGKGVQLCLPHAGSGALANLDMAVMRGDLSLPTIEAVNGLPGVLADVFFYQLADSNSGGVKQCIETNGGHKGIDNDYIAIGFLNADAAATTTMHQMKYQGASATDTEIANGSYDFWSVLNVYLKNNDDSTVIQKMMSFAQRNIPNSKLGIWVKAYDLNVIKWNDAAIPVLQ
jgi:hypothetical protein